MVHHIRHLTPENIGDPKVSLAYDNLMRLCRDCHAFMHSDHSGRRCEFNEDGTIKPVETSLMEQVMMLTQTEDERRNFHRRTHG
jgi:5-methylcytosine-specific restriction endonuclease McrA